MQAGIVGGYAFSLLLGAGDHRRYIIYRSAG
jgi:hypothetical protein